MEKITFNKTRKRHAIIKVLGIAMLAFLMLVNITSAAPYAYTANSGDDTVSVIDITSNKVVATIPVSAGRDVDGVYAPIEVVATPDGKKVYVANNQIGIVSVIDTATDSIIDPITDDGDKGIRLSDLVDAIAISPDDSKLYALTVDRYIAIIDTSTDTVVGSINLRDTSGIYESDTLRNIAVSKDGTKLYIACNPSDLDAAEGRVLILDLESKTVTGSFEVGSFPNDIIATPDGNKVYVVGSYGGDEHSNVICVANTANNEVSWIPDLTGVLHIAINPAGTRVYATGVSTDGLERVYVIDTATDSVIVPMDIPYVGKALAVTPDGTKVCVVDNQLPGTFYTIDVFAEPAWVLSDPVTVGYEPHAIVIVDLPDTIIGGSLVKAEGSSDVYLVENGEKNRFTSPEALLWNGYSFDDVKTVTSETLQSYPDGEDISISQAIIDKYHELGGEPIFGASSGEGEKDGEKDSAGTYCSYVNFENGSIECFKNGERVGKAYAIFNPFFNKWASMGYAKSVLGYPIDNMSNEETSKFGTKFRYQNFANGTEKGALEYNISSGNVYEIHGAIFAKWGAIGYAEGIVGLVTSDEKVADISPQGTIGKYSEFENGCIHWISNKPNENIDHLQRGESFVTYGDLNKMYDEIEGTGSELGFPIKDQETKADGHDYCEFEGGNISWDASSGKYIVQLNNAVPTIAVGQGATTPEITQKFVEAYNRSGGLSVLGNPTTEVHVDTHDIGDGIILEYIVQDFYGVTGAEGGVIVYNRNNNTAYYMRDIIWDDYYGSYGMTEEIFGNDTKSEDIFGNVTSDEKVADISPQGTIGTYTEFEKACIHWISDKDGENVGHKYRGRSFTTFGDLNKVYDEMGGTGSDLGFPTYDQSYTLVKDGTRYRGYCEFEGGNISWDDSTNAYVVKLNNVDSTITVGQNATTTEVTQKFVEAYERNGGLNVLGKPTTEVHYAFGFEVQDFPGVSGIPGGIIMYNPTKNDAFYIHGAIWEKYHDLDDETKAELGHVASDEQIAATQTGKTTGNYTKFDKGTIHWISDKTGENIGKVYRGKAFLTYGIIDRMHTELGGTYSNLGFPTMDEPVLYGKIYDTHLCKFEGGEIGRDSLLGEYHVTWYFPQTLNAPDMTFVQITDVHVGEVDIEYLLKNAASHVSPLPVKIDKKADVNLKNVITEINNMNPKPEFILFTGDLVWYDDESVDSNHHTGNFDKFNDIVKTSTIGTRYYVPGNHDRRLDPTGTLIEQYLTGYNRTISAPTNQPYRVEFDYRGYKFIGFDSEGDYNTTVAAGAKIGYVDYNGLQLPYLYVVGGIDGELFDETPESWGLSETQIKYLEGLDKDQPKIIFMHHPAIQLNGDNDQPVANSIDKEVEPNNYGGNDGCIRWQRAEFIDYCKANNVQLVITGHSHEDEILSASGEIQEQTDTEYPIFVQTDASVNDHGHYRILKVKDGLVTSEAVAAPDNSFLGVFLKCPANLRVYDSQNRYTGLNSSGEVEIGIPNSFYEGRRNDSEPICISLYDVNNEYRFEVVANLTEEQKNSSEVETFNLTIEQYVNESTITTVAYHNVPLTETTVATLPINLTTTSYVMEIDSNGNGVKDETKEPDSINVNGVETIVDRTPPSSVTNLQFTNDTTWLNWTWTNPIDPDFNHTEIYLDGIFQINTSTEYFNATGLQPETDYTIGTRTVDINGNVNETWVNSSAKTKPLPDVAPPVIESVIQFPANTTAGSRIDISANVTDNIGVAEVTADDIHLTTVDGLWRGNITAPSSIGKYSLSIKANDAAGNTVDTSVPYNVVRRQGKVNVAILPTVSRVVTGKTSALAIKVKNTQNIDDTFKVRINVNGIPAFSRAGTPWFNWTEKTVTLRAKQEVVVPIEVKVPAGTITGPKVFRVSANSEKFSVRGSDTGYLVISRPHSLYLNPPKGLRFSR